MDATGNVTLAATGTDIINAISAAVSVSAAFAAKTAVAISGAGAVATNVILTETNAFIEGSIEALGKLDILVNNAGSAAGGTLEYLSDNDWEAALALKFFGYVRCTRAVVPHMKEQGGGRIVNLIGNDGVKPSYWEIAPGAANAAGQNLTLSLAGQYGKDNISFVAVNPGPVRTERWDGLVKAMARDMNLSYDEANQLAPRSIPLGRIAECDEVASLVTYLASPIAHFVNGTMIEIDGGQQKPMMDAYRDG